MKGARNVFLVMIPGFAAVFAVFAIIEFFISPERGIVPAFLNAWHLHRAFQSSCDWLGPLLATSVFLALGISRNEDGSSARGGVAAVLFAGLLAASAAVILAPMSASKSEGMSEASAVFAANLEAGTKSAAAGEWESAARALDAMEIVSPRDKRYLALRQRYAGRPATPAPETALSPSPSPATDDAANDMYLQAKKAFDEGDYYLAHTLAVRAARVDPSRLDAQRLSARAWEKIASLEDSQEEKDLRAFSKDKRESYEFLRNGDPVTAYSRFLKLKEKHPKDQDVDRYLKESLSAMRSIAFFADEISRLSPLPRARRLFFRVPESGQGQKPDASARGSVAFISASSVFVGREISYFTELEYMVLDKGKPSLKVSAPYAKLSGGRLFLACYDRNDPSRFYGPVFLLGGENLPAPNFLDLGLSQADAAVAAIAASPLRSASPWDIVSLCRGGARLGIDPAPFLEEGLMRIHKTVALMLVALLSLFLGLRHGKSGDRRPLLEATLLSPLVFITASTFMGVLTWASGVLIRLLQPSGAARPAIGSIVLVFSLVQAGLIAVAVILIAGNRSSRGD
jgi:hypothetical protein